MADETKLDFYQEWARHVWQRDEPLRRGFNEMESLAHLAQGLPPGMQRFQWVRELKNAAPYKAIRGGTRALSTLSERVHIEPWDDSDETRTKINVWERVVEYQMFRASQRRGPIMSEVVRSSLMYDTVAMSITHIPSQIASLKARGGSTKHLEVALRGGDFMVRMVNPKGVFATHSDYGLENVVACQIKTVRDLMAEEGKKVPEPIKVLYDAKDFDRKFAKWSFWDRDWVCRWLAEDPAGEPIQPGAQFAVLDEPVVWPYGFIPWVYEWGGSAIELEPEWQRQPLLWPVARTRANIAATIIDSLRVSKAIAEFGSPVHTLEGPDPDSISFTQNEPGAEVRVPEGHKYTKNAPNDIDPQLEVMSAALNQEMEAATISGVLITAETRPNETFSGYSMRVQTALGQLMPYKIVAERAMARAYSIFFDWARTSKTNIKGIVAVGVNPRSARKMQVIDYRQIPEALLLTVEARNDVPTDRLQKINGAIMIAKQLRASPVRVLEELGEEDPEGSMREYAKYELRFAKLQGRVQRIGAEEAGVIEQMAMEKAQELLKQQSEAGMAGPGGGATWMPQPEDRMNQVPEGAMGGEMLPEGGTNPAGGGGPAMGAMGEMASFEGQTGATRGGEPMPEVPA